jgi:hypothetical protein
MKRYILILSLISCLTYPIHPTGLTRQTSPAYIDDSYYWFQADTIVSAEPVYDRNIREFIFMEDTVQQSDTVRMRIVNR